MKRTGSIRPQAGKLATTGLALFVVVAGCATSRAADGSPTVLVAAGDSGARSRSAADFACDGKGDQEQINAAIRSLPSTGGVVKLAEGTFDIRKTPGAPGGVIIARSNVTLAGRGDATRLVQAAGQNTNVIRIIGDGVGHVTIRDLAIDANRRENPIHAGDPQIPHDRFEYCGIKAYYRSPGGAPGRAVHDITVRHCRVMNARSLGVMLDGINVQVYGNVLGDAGDDAVEVLTGPAVIRDNYVVIAGRTHCAVGSDEANNVIMSDNIVRVKRGGRLDIGFRSWVGSDRHVIADNILVVEEGGTCTTAMDIRGRGAVVSGNNVFGGNAGRPSRLRIASGGVILTDNVLENVVVDLDDRTGENRPIVIADNIMHNSRPEHRKGELLRNNGKACPSPSDSENRALLTGLALGVGVLAAAAVILHIPFVRKCLRLTR